MGGGRTSGFKSSSIKDAKNKGLQVNLGNMNRDTNKLKGFTKGAGSKKK